MSKLAEGSRIRLISTSDPYSTLSAGEEGIVDFIDGLGTVHVTWDSGSTLGLIPGEDRFRVL